MLRDKDALSDKAFGYLMTLKTEEGNRSGSAY